MAGDKTGSDFYLEFDGVDITADVREFDPGIEDDTTESSTRGSTLRTHLPTKTKVEPTASLALKSTNTTVLAKLKRGVSGSLVWGPQGNSAGDPKAGITAKVIKGYPDQAITYDELTMIEVSWINTGDTWVHDPTTAVF
jgi:hypothetical protein